MVLTQKHKNWRNEIVVIEIIRVVTTISFLTKVPNACPVSFLMLS